MIPKIIHYCWVGGSPLPRLGEKCIESWKKYCPDYQIIRWDESNYDFFKNKYMAQSYEAKKWGFVPDYARLDLIYQHGGIYLDTDVELIHTIDHLLKNKGFGGFESTGIVALGLGFGAEAHNPVIKAMLDSYEDILFLKEDGTLNLTPSPTIQTEVLKRYGLTDEDCIQELGGMFTVYPKEYFNPYDRNTGRIRPTKKTLSIHHYAGSWISNENRRNLWMYHVAHRILGNNMADKLYALYKKRKNR